MVEDDIAVNERGGQVLCALHAAGACAAKWTLSARIYFLCRPLYAPLPLRSHSIVFSMPTHSSAPTQPSFGSLCSRAVFYAKTGDINVLLTESKRIKHSDNLSMHATRLDMRHDALSNIMSKNTKY